MRDAQNSIKNKSVFCTQYSIVVYASTTHNFYSQTNIFNVIEWENNTPDTQINSHSMKNARKRDIFKYTQCDQTMIIVGMILSNVSSYNMAKSWFRNVHILMNFIKWWKKWTPNKSNTATILNCCKTETRQRPRYSKFSGIPIFLSIHG